MLHVLASYHCMQFQRKIINQTWEYCKKISFEAGFGPFEQNSGREICFFNIWLRQSPDIMVSLCAISEKASDSVLRICSDGRTDARE